MTSYFWTVGMDFPYWWVDKIAGNADTETEIGCHTADEFHKWFPHAMPITQQEYEERSVTLAQYMRWRRNR